MSLQQFNDAPPDEAVSAVLGCVSIASFAEALVAGRPYPSPSAALMAADELTDAWTERDVDVALAGHPRVGERTDNPTSSREQAAVAAADAATLRELADGNAEYERRFGRIYLVRAAGRDAAQLLALLRQRLDNPPDVEAEVTRQQLAEITRLRLTELMT